MGVAAPTAPKQCLQGRERENLALTVEWGPFEPALYVAIGKPTHLGGGDPLGPTGFHSRAKQVPIG